jgi:asparagine synthase (glutamine-hydrolysing)
MGSPLRLEPLGLRAQALAMCGIVGIVGAPTTDEARERALAMNARIVHRGPDDEGIWANDGCALAMRRLSIIDLAGGHQPMLSPAGSVLVFNGEIYNFAELRRELAGRWEFRTRSDTEVVLALYELEGISSIERLEGMFAIALLDTARGVLHLVRDRLGKKPLYYTDEPGPTLFASELKGLLAGLATRPSVDRQALDDYLTLRYVPAPSTPWLGVKKLEPGQRLTVDLRTGERALHRWWLPNFRSAAGAAPEAPAEFEALFLAAVEKRLVASDVPVGVLLSGGIDSSAVAAAAVELGHRDFHTFSVGFADGGRYSELGFARIVADRIGSQHHDVLIDRDDFLNALPELVYQTDEPLADLAAIPLHAVSRLAREHVKVVLSGEGADEVLAGYDIEQLARRLQRLRRVPRAAALVGARIAPSGRAEVLGHLASSGWSGILRAQAAHMTTVFDDDEKRRLWRDDPESRPTEALIDSWYADTSSAEPIDQLLEVYCRSWLPEDLLMKADKATMAASLELRTPFLDHVLVEWAAKLPLRWKVGSRADGWQSKRILRQFAAQRLPREIVDRPKQGFPVPAYGWLADGIGAWAEQRLLATDAQVGILLSADAMIEPIRRARAGNSRAAHQVWSLLVLDHWLERWA